MNADLEQPPIPDPAELETYALALAMCAARFVEAVESKEHSRMLAEIRQAWTLTAPDGVDPFVAWSVVLGAQVSTERPLRSRLAWVCDVGIEVAS